MRGATRAAIVSVGNELLFGETVDTNAAWLGRALTAWGMRVVRGYTVRDEVEEIQLAVGHALSAVDVVVVTGGLGPTRDDVTKGAVAELLGLALVTDSAVAEAVAARFRAGGQVEVPELSVGQSEVPEGAVALENEHGTAPGLLLVHDGTTLVLLPGVPREMRAIVMGPLEGALASRGLLRGVVHHRVLHTTGVEEPQLARLVGEAIAGLGAVVTEAVTLAFLPNDLGVDLRMTAAHGTAAEATALLDDCEAALGPVVAPWRFEAPSGDLAESVSIELRRKGLTLAAAESCTGGLLSKRMTDRAGASDVFLGGVVVYGDAVKVAELGVSPDDLERHGAVSETVVRQLATGVARRFDADVGVGITGVAGPGGGSPDKPVGTVWLGVALEGRVHATRIRFAGDRDTVRRRSAQAALALVYRRLLVREART